MVEAKFSLTIPKELRNRIKREARKNDVSMNEYIVTVLQQFVDLTEKKPDEIIREN